MSDLGPEPPSIHDARLNQLRAHRLLGWDPMLCIGTPPEPGKPVKWPNRLPLQDTATDRELVAQGLAVVEGSYIKATRAE